MTLKILLLFFGASFLILHQFIAKGNIINTNDLNGNIVPLLHFKESMLEDKHFPQWNVFMNQGLPVIADPLYGIYNPLISIPILLLPYQVAIKITYFLSILLSCITMFYLLRFFKVTIPISLIISLTYASGTYVASRIVAGHLEKVVSFPLLPLFLYCLIKTIQEKSLLWSGFTAITISLILFAGDIYNALFSLYCVFFTMVFYLFKEKKSSVFLLYSLLLFIAFSSIKIIPMIEMQNYISKIKEPFIGSLNPLSFIYNLFLPFDELFLKFFAYSEFSTGFGWWESMAFIGPISIAGLYFIFKSAFKKHSISVSILVILSVLFLFISIPESKLNPLHYLVSYISLLQFFHVPSRILGLWSILILVALGLYSQKIKKGFFISILLVANLALVYIVSQEVLKKSDFGHGNFNYIPALEWISRNNPNQFYTVHHNSQGSIPQDKAYLNNLLMLQSHYGLFLKDSLAEKYNFKGDPSYDTYKDIKPGFILTSTKISNPNLKIVKEAKENVLIYADARAESFATLDGKTVNAKFSADKISINTELNKKATLALLENNYPGWHAFEDGKQIELLDGRFISITASPGNHVYEFKYKSSSFYLGFVVTILSLFAWGFFVVYNSNIISKKWLKKS